MEVINFYKRVIESLDLMVDNNDFIWAGSENDKVMLTINGKPFVLPTKKHISNLYGKDENGNIVDMHFLYNPMHENSLRGDSESIKKTKVFVEQRLGFAIWAAGTLLLNVAHDTKLQKKTSMRINKFLSAINAANNTGVKELVDEKSLQYWENLYDKILERQSGLVNIYLKKSATHAGVKYNRLATASFPLYDELVDATKDTPVEGIKLRNKDLTIFKIIFEYLLDLEGNTISIGSNDNECPTFIALMKCYLTIAGKTNRILEELHKVNAEIYDSGHIDTDLTISEFDNLEIYKSDLCLIPDTNAAPAKQQPVQQAMPAPVAATPYPAEKPLPVQAADPIENILSNAGYYHRNMMQQQVMPQVPTMGMPMMNVGMQQPMGMQPMPMQMQPMGMQPMGMGMPMMSGMYPTTPVLTTGYFGK